MTFRMMVLKKSLRECPRVNNSRKESVKEEILSIDVTITGMEEVKGKTREALMILFSGNAAGPYFSGKILPGAVDTQQQEAGAVRTLSARYILEGTDSAGQSCRIFIENTGVIGENESSFKTIPVIATNSKTLAWMETAKLEGEVIPLESGVKVLIYSV